MPKHKVDRPRRRISEVGLNGYVRPDATLQPAQHSDSRDRGKQQSVHVGQADHVESTFGQSIAQLAGDVAAFVQVDLVLVSPQERIRRNCHQQVAAGPEDSPHLPEGGHVIVQMLNDVKARDEVIRAVGERQFGRLTQTNILQTTFAAVPNRLLVDIYALSLTK